MQAMIAGEADEYERQQKKKDMRQGIRARDRGKGYRGEGADIVITGNDRSRESQKRLMPWQKSLKEGKYGLALDQVLRPAMDQEARAADEVLTVITALRHRSALRTALANRQEQQLVPVLQWCLQHISRPRELTLVYDVLLLILDLYSHKLPEWEMGDDRDGAASRLIKRLEKRVKSEINLAHQAHFMVGMMGTIEAG